MAKKLVLFGCGGTGENICVKIAEVIATQNWQEEEKPRFVLIDTHSDNLEERGARIRNATGHDPYRIQLKYDRVRQILAYPNRTDNIPKLASCGLTCSTEDGKAKIKYIRGLLAAGADDNGARREPGLGRLAMIAEWSEVTHSISTQIDEVLHGIDGAELQCYIFSSSFGGTGAGIFIPLMYLLRKLRIGDSIKIKLWLLDPSFGNVVHEGVSEEERERFYRNGYRILRELDYIQCDITGKIGEGILPYKTDDPEVPDKELYGKPASKFDNVLLFSRFLHGSLNNINYDEALSKISESFVHVVNMSNQIDENPGDFTVSVNDRKYKSASTGLRIYSSCSCGKITFPQNDWGSLLCKVKEADLYDKALQSQNKVQFEPFPGKTALETFLAALKEGIDHSNIKLKTRIDDFSDASSQDEFRDGYGRVWNANWSELSNKIRNWFDDVVTLAQRTGRKNVALASSILENASNQAKTFKKFLENVKIPSCEIDTDLRDAAMRRYMRRAKKTAAVVEYLDNLCAHYQAKARKDGHSQCLKLFERQKGAKSGIEILEELNGSYVKLGRRLLEERNNLRQQIEKEEKQIYQASLVQSGELHEAEREIKELNGAALGGLNFDEPVYVLTDSTQKRILQKSLEKYCSKNSTNVIARLDAALAPENNDYIDKMKKFRNSCAPLFNYAKGKGYNTDYDPEFSSYIFSNFGKEVLGNLPKNIAVAFPNAQAVNSNKLKTNEVVFLTYLRGLRPDFSSCYHSDFEIAYKKQPREYQGSLDGRLERFEKAAREEFKDFGPKEAEAPSETDVDK